MSGEGTREQASEGGVWRVEGSPTDEELAAVVATLTAAASASAGAGVVAARGSEPDPRELASAWAAHWRTLRSPLPSGPDAWGASAQPRG